MSPRGNVVPIGNGKRRGPKPREETPCPEVLPPEDLRSVLKFAKAHGYSFERVEWAWMAVRGWWESRGIPKSNWAAVTKNALKGFWDKQGFPDWMARRAWRGPEHYITQEAIEKWVERRRREMEE